MKARRVLAALLAAAFVGGCERIDRNMWDNPAYKAQEEPVRLPPEGSVPTKGIARTPSMAEAAALKNPLPAGDRILAEGKELFDTHCSPCHGVSGKGDGPVATKYVPTPMDLRAGSPVGSLPDGILFVMISDGVGGMPPFKADLSPDERWRIVRHLRVLR